MPKQAGPKVDNGSSMLQFLGSLFYLAVAFGGFLSGQISSAGIFTPLLFGAAATATVALFVVSLTDLIGMKHDFVSKETRSFSIAAAFSLIALAAGAGAAISIYTVAVLIGLVLSFIGSGWAMYRP
jgi:hypothetical protein